MKFVLTLLFFTTVLAAKSGGFIFPNVEFSYARLYLFNTEKPSDEHFYDFNIYKDGIYANSKIGNGWEVSQEMTIKMTSIFRTGVDLLVNGLSGCYIPRHGIIYFDQTGTPVASFSVCFECDRIGFWSSQPLAPFKEITKEAPKKSIDAAEKQMLDLTNLFQANGVPVLTTEDEYYSYGNSNDLFKVDGEMIFDYSKTNRVSKFEKAYTKDMVKNWVIKNSHLQLHEKTSTDKEKNYNYSVLEAKGGTWFSFSSDQNDAHLIEANITCSAIKLPNGVSVGMSLEDVQATFDVWDGNAYPASIIVSYEHFTIRYTIKKRTLTQIQIVIV